MGEYTAVLCWSMVYQTVLLSAFCAIRSECSWPKDTLVVYACRYFVVIGSGDCHIRLAMSVNKFDGEA